MSLVTELQRRNVFRVAAAYLVVGWLLTEVLTAILPTLGAPLWVANAVIWIFALGFVPMLVLSWIFEVTPDGLKTQETLDKEGHAHQRRGSKLDYVTITGIVIIVISAGFFGASRTSEEDRVFIEAVDPQSVAVLPFVNMSNDPDNDYFSNGLTETLLHMLAQNPDLKVAARTSSFAFQGQNIDVREIAGTLKVAHILEGSVQKAGNKVRITAQLIRADDGFHVWSENYDREIEDIFDVQDEIAGKVGGALSATLLGTAPTDTPRETENLTAQDMFFRAQEERVFFSYRGLEAAEKYLLAALRVDPQYTRAKTGLATNYIYQARTGLMSREDAFATAGALTEQVLADEPDNVLARAIEMFLSAAPENTAGPDGVIAAIDELRTLVNEHPEEYEALSLLTWVLVEVRQFEEALMLQVGALARDELNPRIWFEVGVLHSILEDYGEASVALNRSLELEPGQPNAHAALAEIALATGDGVEYLRQLLEAMRDDPGDYEMPALVAEFLYRLELIDQGDDFQKLVLSAAPTSDRAYLLAMLRALAAEDDEALLDAARNAIEDDVGIRGRAFQTALEQLILVGRRTGTLEEQMAWLESEQPGLFAANTGDMPIKYRMSQGSLFDAWFASDSRDELESRLAAMSGHTAALGIDPMENPANRMSRDAINGDTEAAIQVAIAEIFTDPVTSHLEYPDKLKLSYLEPVVADSRIQAAIATWDAEKKALRKTVARFLAEFGENST